MLDRKGSSNEQNNVLRLCEVRAPSGGRLSQGQVSGTEAIPVEAPRRNLPDEQLAYILATVFHETGGKMQPGR